MGSKVRFAMDTVPVPVLPLAACRGMDPELFIGADGEHGGIRVARRVERAMKVCRGCDERAGCLEFALAHPQMGGVWGATTAEDRTAIRKDRAGKS